MPKINNDIIEIISPACMREDAGLPMIIPDLAQVLYIPILILDL
jgi:hypothetical protein